ncbi:hypothetical protein LINPERHAP1_LOCUS38084 [Linum perenne]
MYAHHMTKSLVATNGCLDHVKLNSNKRIKVGCGGGGAQSEREVIKLRMSRQPKSTRVFNFYCFILKGEVPLWPQAMKESTQGITWQQLKDGMHTMRSPTKIQDCFEEKSEENLKRSTLDVMDTETSKNKKLKSSEVSEHGDYGTIEVKAVLERGGLWND